MARPPKCRRVAFIPELTYFKPAGMPLRVLEEIQVTVEEAEAIRLKDLESIEQEKCAEKMNISRPTFQRVLESARHKIADALLLGKAIKIDGGNFEMATKRFRRVDGHEWNVSSETIENGLTGLCPTCNTAEISPLPTWASGRGAGSRGRHRGVSHGKQ